MQAWGVFLGPRFGGAVARIKTAFVGIADTYDVMAVREFIPLKANLNARFWYVLYIEGRSLAELPILAEKIFPVMNRQSQSSLWSLGLSPVFNDVKANPVHPLLDHPALDDCLQVRRMLKYLIIGFWSLWLEVAPDWGVVPISVRRQFQVYSG